MILDEQTRDELASGKYRDQRRGSFGTSVPAPGTPAAPPAATPSGPAGRPPRRAQPERPAAPARRPWTRQQERLALIYNEQGLRPDEIARKLGVSTYTATQIVLAARNQAKG